MKTSKYIVLVLIMLGALSSCMDKYTEEFTANSPLYMSYEDLRDAVKITNARELENPGKIYFKDGYIFVNEELKGIHIINNSNPADPENIGFIEIPGNIDMAIKNDILFVDSYVDLVAIDISDINNPEEVKRVEDVFPYTTPPLENYDYRVAKVEEDKGVVIGWEIKKVRQEMEYYYYPMYYRNEVYYDAVSSYSGAKQSTGSAFGIGGSMARFGLYGNYLYAVDISNLHIFDIRYEDSPVQIGKQNVGWDVETMFIYDDHMFLGTQSGMRIYSLTVPTTPSYVSDFWHITSCDPVVVADGYAYITLRGGNTCGGSVNRLDVVELSADYKNNNLIASYPLHGPYGLGIDDQTLFVCDGDAGLKVYDVGDKLHIDDHMISSFPNIKTFDVIPFNDHLFMIGDDGFYQYDYADIQDIKQISHIPVTSDDN